LCCYVEYGVSGTFIFVCPLSKNTMLIVGGRETSGKC
jgi:hypothetical protein